MVNYSFNVHEQVRVAIKIPTPQIPRTVKLLGPCAVVTFPHSFTHKKLEKKEDYFSQVVPPRSKTFFILFGKIIVNSPLAKNALAQKFLFLFFIFRDKL